MKIVLDTNVLIAALIARGVCHQLLEHCISHHELVTSEFILNEVRDKLVEKFKHTSETADEVVRLLRSQLEVVLPVALDAPVCRDADDDNILATAVAGNCECIVTGDKDLLILKQFKGISILSPSEFQSYESTE
ncbi:MAG: putative toxin-antitoxin system toxin component, PIN family [Acidobacteria bacterium 13_1_20CM_3_53_8]|nr:MAG: putative toxin-antitoxin system toxin component, PIN family [Acidobacteria bacterium 13_1_20CM_3_53_8]